MIETVDQLLSFLTVGGQGIIVGLIVAYSATSKVGRAKALLTFVARNALLFAFVIALTATLGSLFYSEIAGYEPCKLCWYQRILMYPQTLLLGIAWLKRDRTIRDYCLALSGLGAGLAAYHYSLQLNIVSGVSCPVVGYSVSCSQRFAMEYGYVTIPLMALTAFLLIIVFLTVGGDRKRAKD
jgi:disulfide bond formation protein DsbB